MAPRTTPPFSHRGKIPIDLQGDGGGQWAYSRRIEPMGMADIVRYHDPDHLGDPLPPIEHQGINDSFEGTAFLVWYYYDGQWLKVAAGD